MYNYTIKGTYVAYIEKHTGYLYEKRQHERTGVTYMSDKLYLILEDGTVFCGNGFGHAADEDIYGEVVFTTSMEGYIETLTDPSYTGQIVCQTFPLIGNYGVISGDFESRGVGLSAYIVKEACEEPSNFRCEKTLSAYLSENGIVGLSGIDTRALTKRVREHGVMNGVITKCGEVTEAVLKKIKAYKCENPVAKVTCRSAHTVTPDGNAAYKIALFDFGKKENMLRELIKRGCEVTVFPSDTTADEILAYAPDGVLLSNGPGDPKDNAGVVAEVGRLTEKKIPIFGICLGHQLLALSQGADTVKLKYGHRGANQPAKYAKDGRICITSQNHGYAVLSATLPEGASELFVNANDGTCEGAEYPYINAFSVQFHPEACAGPYDTEFLFDKFLELCKEVKVNAAQ